MPKRILVLTNRIPWPLKDGGALAMNAMIEGLCRNDWSVYLLSMNTSRHKVPEEARKKIFNQLSRFETVDVNNDLNYWRVLKNYFFSKSPEHADRFYHRAFREKLEQALQEFQPDIVQIESVYLHTYLDTIRSNSEAFVIQRLHNIEYQVWHRLATESTNNLKKRYLTELARRIRQFEQEAWQAADMLIPITRVDATIIRNSGCSTQMHVAPFGISIPPEEKRHKENWEGYHLGAMDWLPNVEAMEWFVHQAWQAIHKTCPEFYFSFAGKNMPSKLKRDLPEGVRCKGEVPDAHSFISDKKILIVPLLSGGGLRIKILEAMAKGKLVISTDIGMQGIDAVAGIHYLAANTAEEFAAQIGWALANKDEAESIAGSAQEFIRQCYDEAMIAEELSSVVYRMLQDSRAQ